MIYIAISVAIIAIAWQYKKHRKQNVDYILSGRQSVDDRIIEDALKNL